MTQQTNPAAEAARETHRSKSTGKFQEHAHKPSAVTLTGDMNMLASRLGTYAEEQKDAVRDASRNANKALISLGARRIAEVMPDVDRVFMKQEGAIWFIHKGFTKDNRALTGDECDEVTDLLSEQPVAYDSRYEHGGIDLEYMRQWLPEGFNPDLDRDQPTQKAVRRAFLALKAGDTDPPAYDPQVRLADALTDFRHYARQHGLNMDEAIRLSAEYHQHEVDEDELAQEESNA